MLWRRAVEGLRSWLATPAAGGASLAEPIKLPAHVAYVHWGFSSSVEILEWDITVQVDPDASVGEYLALFNGTIDGSQCYLGLQTNISHPGTGRGIGKGLIFSTWWSFDASDTRLAEDGFRELGTHEGRFVGVRRPYRWTVGDYRVTLARAESEVISGRPLDWFDLTVQPLGPRPGGSRAQPVGPSEPIGGLRFPRRHPKRAATIEPGGLLFLEVYSGAPTWADVSRWQVDVMAYGDGARCPSGRNEYPRYPHGQEMPNVDVRYDPARERIELSMGAGVVRQDRPPTWS